MNSTLIILGAGCSFKSGYPLANNSFPRLAEFRDSLGDDAVKLRGLVTQTLDLVKKLHEKGESVETLDTLARLLHEGKAGGDSMVKKNRLVLASKISVAALFLFLEREAIQKELPGYRQLLVRVFGNNPKIGYRKAIELSRHRILTFNYDRLFELAFRQYFSDFDSTLKELFNVTKNCRRYLIENPSPDDVCQRLRSLLPKDFSGEVVCKTVSF